MFVIIENIFFSFERCDNLINRIRFGKKSKSEIIHPLTICKGKKKVP